MAEAGTHHSEQYESKAERVTNQAQIIGLLKRLKDGKTLLSVRVEGSGISFTSLLLNINAEKGYILLDEINNERGHQLAVKTGKLRVFCQNQGVELSFTVNIRPVQNKKGISFYQAPIPDLIRYLQRRNEFRVRVGMDQDIHLLMPIECENNLDAELFDVSLGGVGARLETGCQLRKGLIIPSCKLSLPQQDSIETDVEIRFVKEDASGKFVRIGGRFLSPDPASRSRIRKMVTQLEREMLRRKTRGEE